MGAMLSLARGRMREEINLDVLEGVNCNLLFVIPLCLLHGIIYFGMFASASPFSSRQPYFVIEKPKACPWNNSLIYSHRRIPFVMFISEKAQSFLFEHVRYAFTTTVFQWWIDNRYIGSFP